MLRTITITLDDADERHVSQAIAFRQQARDSKGCIIDQGEGCLTGALIAEICRGWLDLHGQLPPITTRDVVNAIVAESGATDAASAINHLADRLAEDAGETVEITLIPSDEGGYTAVCEQMPGAVSEGETVPDALRNLAEAIELWMDPDDPK